MKIKKGDTVKMLSGKDKNKSGKIIKVQPYLERVVVEGLNTVKRHMRPKKQGEQGQVIDKPRAVAVAKVMLVCGKCKKATRIGFKIEGENKIRTCKKCGAQV